MHAAPAALDSITSDVLRRAAAGFATPCYVYLLDRMRRRIRRVRQAFGERLAISYAVKANPNVELLRRLAGHVDWLDVSSLGEVRRGLAAGFDAARMTFSGPAKRDEDLDRAVECGIGEVVCESPDEIERLDRIAGARGRRQPFLIRINPARAPSGFGIVMCGRPGPFGIDEEALGDALARLDEWPNLDFRGFHIYSATNSLSAQAITGNFRQMADLFARFASQVGSPVRRLVFGAGFGIPYTINDTPLDLEAVAAHVNPMIDSMRSQPSLADAACALEIGRYLTGPAGYLLTSIIGAKHSRGVEIRICDAGFNCHLAAFGLMGTVIRRNWPIWKVNGQPDDAVRPYMLTGPLCTAIDVLAERIELPELAIGDLVAIGSSGAYGFSASPVRFISHPEPKEILLIGEGDDAQLINASEREARPIDAAVAGLAERLP